MQTIFGRGNRYSTSNDWDPTESRNFQLTGVAAILTYPLDVDLVEAEEREAKEEAERVAAEAAV